MVQAEVACHGGASGYQKQTTRLAGIAYAVAVGVYRELVHTTAPGAMGGRSQRVAERRKGYGPCSSIIIVDPTDAIDTILQLRADLCQPVSAVVIEIKADRVGRASRGLPRDYKTLTKLGAGDDVCAADSVYPLGQWMTAVGQAVGTRVLGQAQGLILGVVPAPNRVGRWGAGTLTRVAIKSMEPPGECGTHPCLVESEDRDICKCTGSVGEGLYFG